MTECPGIQNGMADYRTIQQSGAILNCWFISAMVGLAYRRPEAIARMIEVNPNGSLTVSLPGHKPVQVGVNPEGRRMSSRRSPVAMALPTPWSQPPSTTVGVLRPGEP